MDAKRRHSILAILVELLVYAGLVVAYFSLVLHFLGDGLLQLYERENKLPYAVAALSLIVGQGLLLEVLTTAFLRWVRVRRR